MKKISLLLLALLTISAAYAAETQARIEGRDVTIVTDQSTDSPKACHDALLQSIKKKGWHDEIFDSADGDKAYLVFSQHVIQNREWLKMRITFWKASKTADGKTAMESQVFILDKSEVNNFLDRDIRRLFLKFSHS
jgi:hypothetical protein